MNRSKFLAITYVLCSVLNSVTMGVNLASGRPELLVVMNAITLAATLGLAVFYGARALAE